MKFFTDPQTVLQSTQLVDTFLEIVKIDTQSDEESEACPSSSKQLNLQRLLVEKLTKLGCVDVTLDDKGYLFATFPGTAKDKPVIGLLAHVDTSPDFSGTNVVPILHKNFKGNVIELKNGVSITEKDSPELKQCQGDNLITADGSTLLGADDKAGVAEILAALEILKNDPSLVYPDLRIAFTPDEEVGRGAQNFDIEKFQAYAAYTLDGGFAGEINAETFSADGATVTFRGVAVHPGYAKDKMVNALRYLGRFLDALPPEESPEHTSGRQGFFHPVKVEGNAAEAKANLILRDFAEEDVVERGSRLRLLVDEIAKTEPRLQTEVEIKYTYRNMAKWLKDKPEITDKLIQAVKDAGIEPDLVPVRGGTDGSGLTAKGLPTPNIFAGGINFHGPREWISTRVMALAVCTVLNLVQRWAE